MKLLRTVDRWLIEQHGTIFQLVDFDIDAWLADENPPAILSHLLRTLPPSPQVKPPASPEVPIKSQEVWAAGVTYQRSRVARMEESFISKSAYDLVYDAPRPEIFFKADRRRGRGAGGGLRGRGGLEWMGAEPGRGRAVPKGGDVRGRQGG